MHRLSTSLLHTKKVGKLGFLVVLELVRQFSSWSSLTILQRATVRPCIERAFEVMNNAKNTGGFSVFAGVGERTLEGNDLYHEMIEGGVIKLGDQAKDSKCTLVYGQIN